MDKQKPRAEKRNGHRPHPLVVIALIICIAGIAVRISAVFSDFWLDEIWTYFRLQSLHSWTGIFTRFQSDNNHYLNSLFMYLLGEQGDQWYRYRLLSLATGIATVPLVWQSLRQFGRAAPPLGAVIFATSYLLIDFSAEARGYGAVVFFTVATWSVLQRCATTRSPAFAPLLWLCISLGTLSHLTFLFVVIAAAVWYPYDLFRKGRRLPEIARDWLSCFGAPMALLAGFYLLVLRHCRVAGGPDYSVFAVLAETLSYMGGEGQFVSPATIVWGCLTAGLTGWSIFYLWKRGRSEWVFFLIAVFLAPAAVVAVQKPEVLFVRYFLVSIAAGYLALAILLADLLRRKGAGRIAVCLFLLLFMAGNGFQTARLLRYGRGGYGEALRYMREATPAGSAITMVSDHAVRNGKLVDFYRRFMPGGGREVLFAESYGCAAAPDWYILHETGDRSSFPGRFIDPCRNVFTRQRLFPHAGPSGCTWAIYKRE